jgi:hypothetical protein
MELENIILREVSQAQRPKTTCSPSYEYCRPKTNAAVLCHTRGRLCKGVIRQGKETKNSNDIDVLTVQE